MLSIVRMRHMVASNTIFHLLSGRSSEPIDSDCVGGGNFQHTRQHCLQQAAKVMGWSRVVGAGGHADFSKCLHCTLTVIAVLTTCGAWHVITTDCVLHMYFRLTLPAGV